MTHGLRIEAALILGRLTSRWKSRLRMRNNLIFVTILVAIVTIFLFACPTKVLNIPNHLPKDLHKGISNLHFLSVAGNTIWNGGQGNMTLTAVSGRSIWNHPRLDILHTDSFHFLPNYKNPCWFEPLQDADVYQNSKYALFSRKVRLNMLDLIKEYSKRLVKHKMAKRLRCLPYFFIVGQPKCGSTDLFQKIIQHPDAIAPSIKETHWWSRNRQGRSLNYTDIIPISDYIDTFDNAALTIERHSDPSDFGDIKYHNFITGEASVSMLWDNDDWEHFPENINATDEPLYVIPDYVRHVIPNSKIIIILRNPTDRLFSDYLYFSKTNKSIEDFHQRVSHAIDTFNNCSMNQTWRSCAYNRTVTLLAKLRLRVGMYVVYLRDWFRVFPREQILILRLEDYAKHLPETMAKVYKFLNLRPVTKKEGEWIFKSRVANKRKFKDKKYGRMKNETHMLLNEFYEPLNKELAEYLNDNRFLWKPQSLNYATNDADEDSVFPT